MILAILAAQKGDTDGAVKHLEAAQETINEVVGHDLVHNLKHDQPVNLQAKALGCTFIQLCGGFNLPSLLADHFIAVRRLCKARPRRHLASQRRILWSIRQ